MAIRKILLMIFIVLPNLSYAAKYDDLNLNELNILVKQGNTDALVSLGSRYEYGNKSKYSKFNKLGYGVERNYRKAFEVYKKAADKGNAQAMYNIGSLYYVGNGVKFSKENSFKWTLKAAEHGHSIAKGDVALMYYQGDGTPKNKALYNKWAKTLSPTSQIRNLDKSAAPLKPASPKKVVLTKLSHSHDGRMHSHPLPQQGFNHRHGNGAYGKYEGSNTITVAKRTSPQNKITKNIEKPSPFCTTQEESMKYAIAYCSMGVGCDAISTVIGNQLSSPYQGFLASSACSQYVSTLKRDSATTFLDSPEFQLFDTAANSLCENQQGGFIGGLGKLFGCVQTSVNNLAKVSIVQECISSQKNVCLYKSRKWLNSN